MSETQVCNVCGEDQPLENFSWRNKKRGIRHGHCKACHAAYRRKHYLENRELYIQKARRWNDLHKADRKAAMRAYILEYFQVHPCVDCGETDPLVLEFDHVRGKKKATISYLVQADAGLQNLKEEIAKCEVRCANCHRRKTAKQLGHWLLDKLEDSE